VAAGAGAAGADDARGQDAAPSAGAQEASFRFVEVDGARLGERPVVGETTIEMVRHDGATMTVRLPSTTALDIGGLVLRCLPNGRDGAFPLRARWHELTA
jgi:hypothetical protein